jgi:fatty-acyl-CoA synthase
MMEPPRELTWAELVSEIRCAGSELLAAGVGNGHPFLILTRPTREQVILFLAAMAIGARPAILSFPSVKQERSVFLDTFNRIVAAVGASWVVCSDEFVDLPDPARIAVLRMPVFETAAVQAAGRPPLQSHAFLQFSSGTTGLRKAVVISPGMLASQATAFGARLGLTRSDIFVSWLPLYHDMGLVGALLVPLYHGLVSIHMSPFEWLRTPELFFSTIHRHAATVTLLPNFSYEFMAARVSRQRLHSEGISLSSLRLVINCSEPVRAKAHEEFVSTFQSFGLDPNALQASYAMAESTFAVTQTDPGSKIRVDRIDADIFARTSQCMPPEQDGGLAFVSCGTPLTGIEIRILGAEEERRMGEICVRGKCVIDGYLTAQETASFLPGGWFKTGDLGYIARGELYVTGRAKDVIIHRGVNVWPTDIEELIGGIGGCKPGRIVVFGVPDDSSTTEEVVALVEVADSSEAESSIRERICAAVNAHFGIALHDAVVVPAGALKKSTSGKLSRAANRKAYLAAQRDPLKRSSERATPSQDYYIFAEGVSWQHDPTQPSMGRFVGSGGPAVAASSEDARRIQSLLFPGTHEFLARESSPDLVDRLIAAGFLVRTGEADIFHVDEFATLLRCSKSTDLVIQFRGMAWAVIGGIPTQTFASITGIGEHNILAIRDQKREYFMNGVSDEISSMVDLIAWLRGVIWTLRAERPGVERVHCMGTSMGAYAALAVGHELQATSVWAFSPIAPNDEAEEELARVLERSDRDATSYTVWYGDENVADRSLALRLKERCHRLRCVPVPTASHIVTRELWQTGQLPRLLEPPQVRRSIEGEGIDVNVVVAALRSVLPGIADLDERTPLLALLDSFATIQLFVELERRCCVRIALGEITQEQMRDAVQLAEAVLRLRAKT